MDEAKKALDKAKVALMGSKDSAFFTTVCFSLKHVWDDSIPTACTNGTEIRFSPKFFLELDRDERVFLLLHESMHVAFLHMNRLNERKPQKWNMAADYVINHMLIERGFKMPKGGLHDPQYAGMSTEQVYDLIPDDEASEFEMDLEPNPGDQKDFENDVADILVRAAIQSKIQGDSVGSIPGDIQIYLDNLLDPKLPWDRILHKYVNALNKDDYSFRKPNRRFLPKHYLPTLYNETLMDITVAVDTSGSVSDADFQRFITEVASILKKQKPKSLTLLQFDTAIKSTHVIRSVSELKEVTFHGRGGTRIAPVIDWVKEHRSNLLIVFSDGEFQNRSADPKVPIIWVIHDNPKYQAPYGKIIHYNI